MRAIRAAAIELAAKHPKTSAQAAKAKADAAMDKGLRGWLKRAGVRVHGLQVTAATVRVTLTRAEADRLLGREG